MEFLKRMKSREMIEMGLKTIVGVLLGLIIIILMEGMIYTIYMKKIVATAESQQTILIEQTIAYCEEIDTDEYRVYLFNDSENGGWQLSKTNMSKSEIEGKGYKSVVWHKPNAFDVSIKPIHFAVMGGFIVAILGVYGWRFYKMDKEYKSMERKYKKTGKMFA